MCMSEGTEHVERRPNVSFMFVYSKATDMEWRYTEDGESVRVSVRTGRVIPLPAQAKELEDFVLPALYAGESESTIIFIQL